MADQVLPALSAAHNRGVVHRDVKPSNILIDAETGFVFLSDFGIAKVAGDDAGEYQTRGFLGTPAYTSPEQATGRALDGRADLYSFGVVLYRLITGRLPYEADEPIALALKHVSGPLPPARSFNPCVPPSVERVLNRALARAPERRYHSGDDLRQALADAVGGRQGPSGMPAAIQLQTQIAPGRKLWRYSTVAAGSPELGGIVRVVTRAGRLPQLVRLGVTASVVMAAMGVVFVFMVLRPGTAVPEPIAPQPTTTNTVALLVPLATVQTLVAVVPTSTLTPTPAQTPTPSLTSTPTAEEAWSALQPVLNELWGQDWPKMIATLEAFHEQHPQHADVRPKLYDSYVEGSKTVDQEQAIQWLDRAISLMPERLEGPALRDALLATPTPTLIPSPIPAAPTPVRAVQVRPPSTLPPAPTPTPSKPAFATPVPPAATPAPRKPAFATPVSPA